MRRALILILANCGRLHFGAANDGGDGSSGAVANRVFLTSGLFDGALGNLAGADATCAAAASAAGLDGTFVAWLSTTNVDAIDRLTGSRGWVLLDGRPAIDTIDEVLTAERMFNPIDVDEHGARVTIDSTLQVWTGTEGTGLADLNTCGDWTTTAVTGSVGDAYGGGTRFTDTNSVRNCTQQQHLYCFEVGHSTPTAPAGTPAGRIAFVSTSRTIAGLAGLDTLCADDAAAAGLPGTYLAAVATATSTVANRFTADARPIVRVDATVVTSDSFQLLGGFDLESFVIQHADGSFYIDAFPMIMVGAGNPTSTALAACTDWTDTTTNGAVLGGDPRTTRAIPFWTQLNSQCNRPRRVLCLQQ